ncbi:hypothetical protein ACFV0B_10740 [Streptomyces xanthophaeus]|uniref:hypothetical protein n=1 Tax=Streptomyces xanthophaeus TaxID=67385 RepID=UPI00369FA977
MIAIALIEGMPVRLYGDMAPQGTETGMGISICAERPAGGTNAGEIGLPDPTGDGVM